jgi:3-hydroxymyristoyl/3-hydroxydecanoyl-(acyl carrier protein) dehydratase
MNFLFVDQILAFEPGKGAIGIKHVTACDTYLTRTPSGKPALLPCVVGETVGQLCGWYVIKQTQGQLRAIAGIISAVNIYDYAYVGDTIQLQIWIDHLDEQAVNWHGEAKVRDKTILVIEGSVGPCLPMQNFNDPQDVLRQLNIIDRPSEMSSIADGEACQLQEVQYNPGLTTFDKIISWEKGKQVIAQKNVSIIAPYFIDHFPRKPVLPLTLLLETKLQLGKKFLEEHLGATNADTLKPLSIRNIKMKEFLSPGTSLIAKLTIKEESENHVVLSFHSVVNGEVNNKTVCVAEAKFVYGQ